MFKKAILGALAVGLVAVLVLGAVNRTQSKMGEVPIVDKLYQQAQGVNGAGQGNGGSVVGSEMTRPDDTTAHDDAGNSDRGQGYGANGVGQGASTDVAGSFVSLTGVVTAIESEGVLVTLEDGKTIEVYGRGWRFAQESGFTVQLGDKVTLTGFYEGEDFETATLANLSNGLTAKVRDESGRPLWSGRGRTQ